MRCAAAPKVPVQVDEEQPSWAPSPPLTLQASVEEQDRVQLPSHRCSQLVAEEQAQTFRPCPSAVHAQRPLEQSEKTGGRQAASVQNSARTKSGSFMRAKATSAKHLERDDRRLSRPEGRRPHALHGVRAQKRGDGPEELRSAQPLRGSAGPLGEVPGALPKHQGREARVTARVNAARDVPGQCVERELPRKIASSTLIETSRRIPLVIAIAAPTL